MPFKLTKQFVDRLAETGELVVCPSCRGAGNKFFSEDDGRHEGHDACYHCSTEGWISYDQWRHDRMQGLAERIAGTMVSRSIAAANANPDGEGWAFAAAESMMSEHDYTTEAHMSRTDQMMRFLEQTDPDIVWALCDMLNPEPTPVMKPGLLCKQEDTVLQTLTLRHFDPVIEQWLCEVEGYEGQYVWAAEADLDPLSDDQQPSAVFNNGDEDEVPF